MARDTTYERTMERVRGMEYEIDIDWVDEEGDDDD